MGNSVVGGDANLQGISEAIDAVHKKREQLRLLQAGELQVNVPFTVLAPAGKSVTEIGLTTEVFKTAVNPATFVTEFKEAILEAAVTMNVSTAVLTSIQSAVAAIKEEDFVVAEPEVVSVFVPVAEAPAPAPAPVAAPFVAPVTT